jgi:Flp pilus assembly protein TadG
MAAKRPVPSEFDGKTKPAAKFTGITNLVPASFPMGKALKRVCRSGEEGQTIVESAFSMLILLMTVLGIMDLGLALYSYDFVADAAREGARYAIVHGSTCVGCVATQSSVETYVKSLGLGGIRPADLTVTTTWPDTSSCTPSASPCNNRGNNVVVTVNYVFRLNIPLIPSSSLNLSSTSESIIAQ